MGNFDDIEDDLTNDKKTQIKRVGLTENDKSIITNNDDNSNEFNQAIEPKAVKKREPKVTNDKYYKRHTEPFNFSSKLLRDSTKIVYNATTSGYVQINIKTLQNIAYIFNYAGFKLQPFYLTDLSPSGTGKGENISKNSDLFLKPILDIEQEKRINAIDEYKRIVSESKSNKEASQVPVPKNNRCIHGNDISKEALYESFEAIPSQMIEMSELGLRLEKKDDPVIAYIVDGHSKDIIKAPNYKNASMKKNLFVENISLFFTGDTNLEYLSKELFYKHLGGGLINRCMIIYNDYIPSSKDYPEYYYIDKSIKEEYSNIVHRMIKFSKECSSYAIPNNYIKSSIFKEYNSYLQNKKKELLDNRNPFGHFYNRANYNFTAIIQVLHLVKCFEANIWSSVIVDDTIKEAIELCKIYFDFSGLINELNGTKAEEVKDLKTEKVMNYISSQKLPLNIRDSYRALNITKSELLSILAGKYTTDNKQITRKL